MCTHCCFREEAGLACPAFYKLSMALQVVALAEYRAQLFDYLRSRMSAIAPNLTVGLVGKHCLALPAFASSVARMPLSQCLRSRPC